MAFPAAPTESGGARLHFGTTDGNAAAGWFAVDTGVTGTGANTVGFLAVATHVHDDAAGGPGGLATTSVPLVVVGAVRDDALGGLAPAEGDAVYLLVDENGALWTHSVVGGDVAHDGLDSGGGGPVKIGGRAQEPEAQPEEVADNDRTDALFDRNGYLRVRGDFEPQYMAINTGSVGDNSIIGAQPAGKRIAVWSYFMVADGTVDARLEDGAGGTAFTGQVPLQVREGWVSPAGGLVPLFVGSAATPLNLELSAAIQVHGSVSYTVVDD